MNRGWLHILRNRELAAVRIHRKPYTLWSINNGDWEQLDLDANCRGLITHRRYSGPMIEIVFKQEFAAQRVDNMNVDQQTYQFKCLGFADMEFFDLDVGKESDKEYLQRLLRENKLRKRMTI